MKNLHLSACQTIDPAVFDVFVFPGARRALTICGRCPVTQECLDWVKPQKSFFDGVAGGVVWRNGYRVRPDNSTREDRIVRIRRMRGETIETDTTEVPEIFGQGTLPFD